MLISDFCEEEYFKTPTFLRRLRHLRPELVPGLEAGLRLTEITCLMLGIDSRDQVPDADGLQPGKNVVAKIFTKCFLSSSGSNVKRQT